MILDAVALTTAVAHSIQSRNGCFCAGQDAVFTIRAHCSVLAQAAGRIAARHRRSSKEGRILDLEVHHGCVSAPVGVVSCIAHLIPVLHFIQKSLFCIAFITHDVCELFQGVCGIQGCGVVAVVRKSLYRKSIRASLVIGHVIADFLQHVIIAAVHRLVIVCLILTIRIPVGVGHAHHLLAFRHHVQIAHRAVTGDRLVEEPFAVIAKDRPYAAKGEGRTLIDAGCLACTGASLHGGASPQHHPDAGAIASHRGDIVHVGAVFSIRPGQIAELIAQIQTHIRVSAKVTRCHNDSICIYLEVFAVDIRKDGALDLAILMDKGQTLGPVDILTAHFHGLLLQQADGVGPHIVVGIGLRARITPLGHAYIVVAVAAGILEILVALIVDGMGILCNIIGIKVAHHPVQRLARTGGIILDDLLVGMAQSLHHILSENIHRVVLFSALVQEELRVAGGHVAGIVIVLFPGLHFAANRGKTFLCAAQRCGCACLAGTNDQDLTIFGVFHFVCQLRLIPQPGRLVVHELIFGDIQGIHHAYHHGTRDIAVALLLNVFLRRLGAFASGLDPRFAWE